MAYIIQIEVNDEEAKEIIINGRGYFLSTEELEDLKNKVARYALTNIK